ncbi:MAG: DNA primase [Gaiellales bacterium]
MSRIADRSVEAVRDAVDMVDLVGTSTQLKRTGTGFMGRCPFHEEKSASFSVDPVKKLYHCFGCQRGGDHVKFVQERQNLDFVGAVEWLADRYGVTLEYEQSSPADARRRDERRRMLKLLDDAAVYYSRYLWDSREAAAARSYLEQRGIGQAVAEEFRLGYSPAAWDRLCAAARGKGSTPDELQRAGLSVRGRRGPVDRFRARLMFPLTDARGQVRGFGGRQLPGGDPPKYTNSPEGPLFSKSAMVYGLDRARAAIAKQGRAVVVEGYTDVLALHQAGISGAVASMGTALTARQVSELRPLCSTLVLAFDADAAGQEASVRGIELALEQGLEVRLVALPAGRDPADMAVADAEGFMALLDRAQGFLAFRVERLLAASDSRDRIYQRAQQLLSAASPSVERDEQVRLVTDRLGLSADLAAALTASSGPAAAPVAGKRVRRSAREMDERLFVGMCFSLGAQVDTFLTDLDVADFSDASLWEAATYARREAAGEATPEEAHTWASLKAELNALAAREGPSLRVLEELFWKIKLHSVAGELKNLGSSADLGVRQQEQLQKLQQLRLSYLERLEEVRAQAPDR